MDTTRQLDCHLDECRNQLRSGETYRGYLELARAYDLALSNGMLSSLDRELYRIQPDDQAVIDLTQEIRSQLNNIGRILSIGEVFQPEEALNLLCKRLNIAQVMSLMREGYKIDIEIDTTDVDALIYRRLGTTADKPCRKLLVKIFGRL